VWAMPAFTRPYNAAHFAERGRHPLILDALPDLSMPRDGAGVGCLDKDQVPTAVTLVVIALGATYRRRAEINHAMTRFLEESW
jgi:hypothetical protein